LEAGGNNGRGREDVLRLSGWSKAPAGGWFLRRAPLKEQAGKRKPDIVSKKKVQTKSEQTIGFWIYRKLDLTQGVQYEYAVTGNIACRTRVRTVRAALTRDRGDAEKQLRRV